MEEQNRYQEFLSKWIKIYVKLLEEDEKVEELAVRIGSRIPFNFAKPQTISAACVAIASAELKKPKTPKDMIGITGISMRSFIGLKNYIRKKGWDRNAVEDLHLAVSS